MSSSHCPRCGGQVSSHAARCPWCGHSTGASTLIQLVFVALMVAGAGFVTGLLPWNPVARFVHLHVSSDQTYEFGSQPAVDQAGDLVTADGSGSTSARSGGGGSASSRPAGDVRPTTTRSEPAECDSPGRLDRLASRYQGWSRTDLALIACRRIRQGFSEAQVVAALGGPVTVNRSGRREVWQYAGRSITLEDGKVVAGR